MCFGELCAFTRVRSDALSPPSVRIRHRRRSRRPVLQYAQPGLEHADTSAATAYHTNAPALLALGIVQRRKASGELRSTCRGIEAAPWDIWTYIADSLLAATYSATAQAHFGTDIGDCCECPAERRCAFATETVHFRFPESRSGPCALNLSHYWYDAEIYELGPFEPVTRTARPPSLT